MNQNIVGKYALVDKDAENFDKYMSTIGVNFLLRKAAKYMAQQCEVILTEDGIQIITSSTVRSSNETFVWNVGKKVTTMDGRSVESTLTFDAESQKCTNTGWFGF